MDKEVINHYLEFGIYTNPGFYREALEALSDDIKATGNLVRSSFIHRTTLAIGNTGTNEDLRFGDMNQMPWYRQPEDDVLVTTPAMLAELYRRDSRGFIEDRAPENKLVLTCRYVAVLMASILKSKGIPTRVRAGHAPYFDMGELGKVSTDHWINQYWDSEKNHWITIDVDGSWSLNEKFNPYDIPDNAFDFAADAWIKVRSGDVDPDYFYNAKPERGTIVVLWSLFYDFHCLMNNEIPYIHIPKYGRYDTFKTLGDTEYAKIDRLAELMVKPDDNLQELKQVWEADRDFRLLTGGLL
ncbi:MAG: transglutaminase domain-containing protein [bacterium]|nr:transglutaminase domain-containing protein [bacterium]